LTGVFAAQALREAVESGNDFSLCSKELQKKAVDNLFVVLTSRHRLKQIGFLHR
jgi:hypothetical protein